MPALRCGSLLVPAVAALIATGSAGALAEPNPFPRMAGAWKGEGTLSPLGGTPERVICRARYGVSGAKIDQTIECAGTDYRINAVGKLTYSDGRIQGSWREKNYGTDGGARGSVKGDRIYIRISGEKFNGRMVIRHSPDRQSVNITQFDAGTGKYTPVIDLNLRR